MEHRLAWAEEAGLDVDAGLAYTGGAENYLVALQRYYRAYEKSRRAVEDFYASGDIEAYGIKVHALKSNSRMIGAEELAAAFEALEQAAGAGDRDILAASTVPVLEQYALLAEKLRPLGEAETIRAHGELSAGEARETAEKLLAALDDFDDEMASGLAAKLAGYPFRPTQKARLAEAAEQIGEFLYDEAADCIRELLPAIE